MLVYRRVYLPFPWCHHRMKTAGLLQGKEKSLVLKHPLRTWPWHLKNGGFKDGRLILLTQSLVGTGSHWFNEFSSGIFYHIYICDISIYNVWYIYIYIYIIYIHCMWYMLYSVYKYIIEYFIFTCIHIPRVQPRTYHFLLLRWSYLCCQVMHVSASICPGAVQVHFKRNGTLATQPTNCPCSKATPLFQR